MSICSIHHIKDQLHHDVQGSWSSEQGSCPGSARYYCPKYIGDADGSCPGSARYYCPKYMGDADGSCPGSARQPYWVQI